MTNGDFFLSAQPTITKRRKIMSNRRLIRYAGYDPFEKVRVNCRRVPVERAIALRSTGLNWRQVAAALGDEYFCYFTADAIAKAVRRSKGEIT